MSEEETNVAGFDQAHAQAIDLLRKADVFLLAVPHEDEEGEKRIVITAAGTNLVSFRNAIAAVLNAESWDDIVQFLHRDRWLRRALIAAVTVNLLLVVFNLSNLLR